MNIYDMEKKLLEEQGRMTNVLRESVLAFLLDSSDN